MRAQFKQFFSITGDYPDFTWTPGHESIPENWYRRPSPNQYGAAGVFTDLIPQFFAYPSSLKFGGNTGTTNSFVGFDFGDLTGGAFDNADDLFQGDNLQCFFAQAALAGIPDALSGGVAGAVTSLVSQYLDPLTQGVTCLPGLALKNELTGTKYPGATYNPQPAAKRKMRLMN